MNEQTLIEAGWIFLIAIMIVFSLGLFVMIATAWHESYRLGVWVHGLMMLVSIGGGAIIWHYFIIPSLWANSEYWGQVVFGIQGILFIHWFVVGVIIGTAQSLYKKMDWEFVSTSSESDEDRL